MTEEAELLARARELTPGSRLGTRTFCPTRVTCFLFALAWWAPHRIHYDPDLARAEGFGDVMVPGLLLSEWVVTAVTSWTGDPTRLRRMSYRNSAPAFAGDTLTVESTVAEVTDDGTRVRVAFDVAMTDSAGRSVLTGRAEVEVD